MGAVALRRDFAAAPSSQRSRTFHCCICASQPVTDAFSWAVWSACRWRNTNAAPASASLRPPTVVQGSFTEQTSVAAFARWPSRRPASNDSGQLAPYSLASSSGSPNDASVNAKHQAAYGDAPVDSGSMHALAGTSPVDKPQSFHSVFNVISFQLPKIACKESKQKPHRTVNHLRIQGYH